jgi:hypothetical protein
MTEFYVLDMTNASDHQLYAGGQCVNDTSQHCPACGVLTDTSGSPEIKVALSHLGRQGFAEHLWGCHPIFRRDLIEAWKGANLTGFDVRPAWVVGWYQKPRKPLPENIPSYYWLITTSKVRLVEPKAVGGPCPVCGFIEYKFPKTSNHLRHGLRIDSASWDGADIFGLKQYEFIFCTRRVAEVTLKAGYNRHIAFVRLEDYRQWDDFDVRKWTLKAYRKHVESFLIRRPEDL